MGNIILRRVCASVLSCTLFMCINTACTFMPTVDEVTTSNEESVGGEAEVKLTQRQIEILTEVGLPTDYTELNSSQRNDIMAIEEMLCYLEDTYKTAVTYKTYTQSSPINDAALTAEVEGYVVTVSRRYEEGKYVYTDDYAAVSSTEKYEEAIKNFFDEKGLDVKVYAEISTLENGTEDILSSANGSVFVFVNGEMERTELEALVASYGEWYSPKLNGVANSTRFYVVSEYDYLDIGRETYYDCLQEVPNDKRIMCIISSDGSVSTK